MPRYTSGYEAARADGWCIQCLRRQEVEGRSMCERCAELRNARSRRRNERRPTQRMTRRRMQDLFEGARTL